jgi:hypothetical protein
LVGDAETQTTLVYDGTAKTLTYNGENGTPTVIDLSTLSTPETVTTLVNAADGKHTYTSENNTVTTIDVVSDITTNASTIFNDPAVVNQLTTIVKNNETATTLAQNLTTGDITYTNETGTASIGKVVSTASGNLITAGADGGSFINNAAIKANETITVVAPVVTTGNTIATYTNEAGGTPVNITETLTTLTDVVTQDTDPLGQLFDVHTLTYKDEAGINNPIDLSTLVKGVESLTALGYDGATHTLNFLDEKGNTTTFDMVDLIGESETVTKLEVNGTATLDFTDEAELVHALDLAPLVKEPWYSTATNTGATLNTENIYSLGWVGIGFTVPSAAPNEKLRVNGAITTVNSYYADYVFEDYFKGSSLIKADYKFKPLAEVDAYIKKNNHLPGITPINELVKTKEGYSFNVSELSIQLLEKTEELYLHIIEQDKEIQTKNIEILELKNETKELKVASELMNERLKNLEKLITEKTNQH